MDTYFFGIIYGVSDMTTS